MRESSRTLQVWLDGQERHQEEAGSWFQKSLTGKWATAEGRWQVQGWRLGRAWPTEQPGHEITAIASLLPCFWKCLAGLISELRGPADRCLTQTGPHASHSRGQTLKWRPSETGNGGAVTSKAASVLENAWVHQSWLGYQGISLTL